ncbi:MAG: hypothetical protein M0Q92_00710 [Methanoregula sp.]|jgi:hypothetical protein|nr:hypothetical protein [Methanoregula sp.]
MLEKEFFKIAYEGDALVSHEMNVKDLAPALLSIGELLEEANLILNGDRVKITVNIKATTPGSILIDFSVVQDLLTQATSLFNSDGVNAFINARELLSILGMGGTGGVILLIKWLRNRKIKSVIKLDTGDYKIELEDGEAKITNDKEIKLFGFLSIRKKIESVIRSPLSKDGIDKLQFIHNGEINEINKKESEYFLAPVIEEEVIDERDIESNLQIVNISFQEDGKWRFSDGLSTFFAEITDGDFIDKIQRNEKFFAKDDLLRVTLKRKQSIVGGAIKTDYIITKVLEHRSAAVQIKLPFKN